MAGNVFKNPPSFTSDGNYESWKKDIAIWCKLTDIAKEKQALAIHLVLTGKARQASSEVEISDLEKPDGVEYLIRKLDQLFLMDESRRQFRAFQELYNLRRIFLYVTCVLFKSSHNQTCFNHSFTLFNFWWPVRLILINWL